MGYITDLDACTDPTTGDYLLIADASASAGNRDRKVNVSEFALTEAANTFTLSQVMPTVRTNTTGAMADNTAISFTPIKSRGILLLSPAGTAGGMGNLIGLVYYDTVAPATQILVVGSNVEVATGALTGTTGSDAKVTVSAHTDGKIYFENRIGYSPNWAYLIL